MMNRNPYLVTFTPTKELLGGDSWFMVVEYAAKYAVEFNYTIENDNCTGKFYGWFPTEDGELSMNEDCCKSYSFSLNDTDWPTNLINAATEFLSEILWTEINVLADVAIEQGWSDDEFYQEALNRGFVPDYFPDPSHAKSQLRYYKLT